MELPSELVPPRCAIPLPYLGLEGDEARWAQSLLGHLIELEMQAHRMGAALALIEYSESLPLPWQDTFRSVPLQWRWLAFREGAMCLSNFYKSFEAVRNLAGRCTTIAPLVDTPRLKEANHRFEAKFKRAEKLRDTTAHPELYPNPDKFMTGSPAMIGDRKVDFTNQRVSGSFHDRIYFATISGLTLQYELAPETVRYVVDLVREVFSCFEQVSIQEVARLREAS